ncbi:hypothetical protein L9F63_008846 [Diploptera punctata]|uniref:PRELI/MSF1 domain-containing protein n=1 Tax=Diploptera punctata TaxID=6984 RepID=A0AAD8E1B1_DIPPU|nr:hypothetical protein L9F63_008846 [Diploptera punctata]
MTKEIRSNETLRFSWYQVAIGFFQRYPNPQSLHVQTEDVIHREVKDGILITRRLWKKTNKVPTIVKRLIAIENTSFLIEESTVDPKSKIIHSLTHNINYRRWMKITEDVTLTVSPENDNWTLLRRKITLNSPVRWGTGRFLEGLAAKRLNKNCIKMVQGFVFVLNKLFPKNIDDSFTNCRK